MGVSIIHHNNVFNFYSTVIDGPYFTEGLTRKQAEQFLLEEYGHSHNTPKRFERAISKGTSSNVYDSLEEQIQYNRSGENYGQLTSEEFIKKYLTLCEHNE